LIALGFFVPALAIGVGGLVAPHLALLFTTTVSTLLPAGLFLGFGFATHDFLGAN
jgi:hypothetical protein